ncbi:MAG TPA: hypothetical protein VMJ10_34470 [Kofleriaceae bacterium]|nr:hypothetical protein [Kofleriaceae bacterium]
MRAVPVLVALTLAIPAYADPGVRVYQSANDPSITEGEATVPGDPSEIFAVVEDYARWVEVFPDVARVIVTWRHGRDARVTLVKPDGNRDNLSFHETPQARMLTFQDTGNAHAEVWGEIVCVPGDQPGTTRIHTRLYADVHGIASIVVRDGDVRKMREQRVQRDLVHVLGYFSRVTIR